MTGDELLLDPVPQASRIARRWVVDRLAGLGHEALGDTAELLTAEVVTNAVLHAGTPIVVSVRAQGRGVRIDVVDRSSTEPVRRSDGATASIGRGLWMLDQLAQQWSWSVTETGKVVWFVLTDPSDTVDPAGGPPDPADGDALIELWSAGEPGHGLTHPVSEETGLGRYGTATTVAAAGDLVEIRLLGLPVRLLAASQEHHDTLLRELRLMALAEPHAAPGTPSGLADLVEELGVRYAANRPRRDREVQRALADGVLRIDQVFSVPPEAGERVRHLSRLLAEADRYCAENLLLTLQRPALVRRFADWYCEQVVSQIAGHPPQAWAGPLAPDADGS